MNILAIDTSCDETAAAVTENQKIVSNIIWSQASQHAEFGGVMPSLAQRMHEERIDWVVNKALGKKYKNLRGIDTIAVTVGPGLSIALGVGINKAKELATKCKKPLIPVNHIEAHLLSPLANSKNKTDFPALGLVLSGGTTLFCLMEEVGKYKILAQTQDDALGEALDKGARLLGLGYPGAAFLEKLAKEGDIKKYSLPTPLTEDKEKNRFSYSGLKSAFVRLFNSIDNPGKKNIKDLAAAYQEIAFKHVIKVLDYQISKTKERYPSIQNVLFGGGVANNVKIKTELRKLCTKHKMKLLVPPSKKLMGDNAGMIGLTAYLKNKSLSKEELLEKHSKQDEIDRIPRLSI